MSARELPIKDKKIIRDIFYGEVNVLYHCLILISLKIDEGIRRYKVGTNIPRFCVTSLNFRDGWCYFLRFILSPG